MRAERILVADAEVDARRRLREILADTYEVEEVESRADALARLAEAPPRVLVVGNRLADATGRELLTEAAEKGLLSAPRGPAAFALADASGASPDVDLQQVPIFYRLTGALGPERVRELIAQAIARAPGPRAKSPTQTDAFRTRQILEHAKQIGLAPDLAGAARAAISAVTELVRCDRARVLFYDDESGTLWSELDDGEEWHASSAGVAGFAVRAGSRVALPRAADEPLYTAAIDDPQGNGRERLAAQPIADPDGRVHGVVLAIRAADARPFSAAELRDLEALAAAWAPFLHHHALRQEADHAIAASRAAQGGDMFRQEAIEHFMRRGHQGDVVRVHPGWIHAAYWLVVVFVLGGLAYAAVAQVHKWSQGAAVVRVTGRTDVTTYESGTITALAVRPDQSVVAGQELARLHDAEQAAALRTQNAEFERKLVAYLQTPGDPAVKQALSALVAARDNARARSESRVIRAPHDGIVKSVHVAPGQRVEAGRTILSIVEPGADEGLLLYAFLPQSDTSQIDVGQRMRFAIPGYRGAYLELEVAAVSEPMGAGDARERYLGDRFRDGVVLAGQVVVVQARLSEPTFTAGGKTYQLHDGMIGVAEVQLESRSVLEALVPGS